MNNYTCERDKEQEIIGNKTIIFSTNKNKPNKDYIDLYNILKKNVEVLERVEKLLEGGNVI